MSLQDQIYGVVNSGIDSYLKGNHELDSTSPAKEWSLCAKALLVRLIEEKLSKGLSFRVDLH